MEEKKVVALVPMKGHSERVPNKNIRDISGKPLYHWIISSLLNSRYIKKVVINTDSKAIAEDALNKFNEIRIIEKPEEIRGDYISVNEIIAYDLTQTEDNIFHQARSTNPLLTTETIEKAIEPFFCV